MEEGNEKGRGIFIVPFGYYNLAGIRLIALVYIYIPVKNKTIYVKKKPHILYYLNGFYLDFLFIKGNHKNYRELEELC